MATIKRKLLGDSIAVVQRSAILCATFGLCSLVSTAAGAQEALQQVEFQEMRFTLPAGQWQRSPGSPPTTQVLFTLKQGDRRVQSFSVWRVSYQKGMYGLTPEEHTKRYFDYVQFEKPRPTPWGGFARSTRTIAGKEHPVMTYQWHHPTGSNPEVVADGIFLAYFPDDFQKREHFYILQWEEIHPPGEMQQGLERLDQIAGTFAVGPVQDRAGGPDITLPREFSNVWYRPGDRGFSFKVYSASGKLVITETRLVFGGADETLEIDAREIKSVTWGRMRGDNQNDWAIIRYGEPEKVAGFKDGNRLGWGTDTKLIHSTLMSAFERSISPAKITLVDPKTEKTAVCPDGLFESRMMTQEQAAQQRAWHTEFQRTNNRLPTPMEGCLKLYEILGFVRKPQ